MRTSDELTNSWFRLRSLFLAAVIWAGLLAVFLWQSRSSWSSFEIKDTDVTELTEFTIAAERFPSGLTIKVSGRIDGQALVYTHLGRVTAIGPGHVSETISGDIYVQVSTVLYRPQKVTKGRLLVTYKFHYF